MTQTTDIRIINWIAQSLEQGVEITTGQVISGRIPEAGKFYDGADRGMVEFSHTVTEQDLKNAAARMRA